MSVGQNMQSRLARFSVFAFALTDSWPFAIRAAIGMCVFMSCLLGFGLLLQPTISFAQEAVVILVVGATATLALMLICGAVVRILLDQFYKLPVTIVKFDDDRVTVAADGQSACSLVWENIEKVIVETTDAGPMSEDVFWILCARDEQNPLVVPSSASGMDVLLAEFQKRLVGFDNEMLIAALGSCENRSFLIWQYDADAGE